MALTVAAIPDIYSLKRQAPVTKGAEQHCHPALTAALLKEFMDISGVGALQLGRMLGTDQSGRIFRWLNADVAVSGAYFARFHLLDTWLTEYVMQEQVGQGIWVASGKRLNDIDRIDWDTRQVTWIQRREKNGKHDNNRFKANRGVLPNKDADRQA